MNIKEASNRLTTVFIQAIRDGEGSVGECNDEVNNASRDVILAYHKEHGECWLGEVNPPNKDKSRILVKYDPEKPIHNFCCGFVTPSYDAELVRLIEERLDCSYTTSDDDYKLITAIDDRRTAIGGRSLFWS